MLDTVTVPDSDMEGRMTEYTLGDSAELAGSPSN